jgi:hypothetical protein
MAQTSQRSAESQSIKKHLVKTERELDTARGRREFFSKGRPDMSDDQSFTIEDRFKLMNYQRFKQFIHMKPVVHRQCK